MGDQQSMWQAPTAGRGGHADGSADAASVASAGTCSAADPPPHTDGGGGAPDACATRAMGRLPTRERLEARWHEQAAERGVVAHTTAPTAHRSAQRVVLEARAVLLADQVRRRASGAAAEGEAQTTASAAHRSAQRAVQEATRREELRRRGERDEAEAVEHYEYEEYNNTSPRRSRSRSRPRTATWSRPTDEVEEEWSWEVRSHSE